MGAVLSKLKPTSVTAGVGYAAAIVLLVRYMAAGKRKARGVSGGGGGGTAADDGAAASGGVSGDSQVKGKKKKKKGVRIDAVFVKQLRDVLSHAVGKRELLNVAALTATLVARTGMSLAVASNMGTTISYFCNQDWPNTLRSITRFGLMTVVAALLNSMLKFLIAALSMNMRQRLTGYVHGLYFKDKIYYRANKVSGLTSAELSKRMEGADGTHVDTSVIRLENADQLIADDIDKFAETCSDLYANLLKPVVDFVMFSAQLANMMGPTGPLGMYTWFGVATVAISKVLPPFGKLAAQEQALEGRFRAAHAELINNSEMVAFLKGEGPERKVVESHFAAIRRHVRGTLQRKFVSDTIAGYLSKYFASVVGFLLVLRPVMNGSKGTMTPAAIAQYYVSSRQVMEGLSVAVLSIFELQKRVGKLAGITSRVSGLLRGIRKRAPILQEAMATHAPEHPPKFVAGDCLRFEHVCVFKPDGVELVHDLNFEVLPGKRVLITGPNGVGKSSLFRIIKGLWPLVAGTITHPDDRDIYFLSQVNFVPFGTLRHLVTYPRLPSDMEEMGRTDEDIRQVLSWAHLDDLQCDGVTPTLDTTLDWRTALSPGQKQRMAFARLLFHRPRFAILDECTAGVSPDVEEALYERCAKLGMAIFSISHKLEMKRFHDYELHYDGKGGYTLTDLRETR